MYVGLDGAEKWLDTSAPGQSVLAQVFAVRAALLERYQAKYMGHADPTLTLRVYAHLMPESRERARRGLDAVFQSNPSGDHGPQPAQ